VIPFAELLSPHRAVDLALIVLPGLPEHGQEHDDPIGSTPVRYPGRNLAKPNPQLPDSALQVV
jgi:hypothetical protein